MFNQVVCYCLSICLAYFRLALFTESHYPTTLRTLRTFSRTSFQNLDLVAFETSKLVALFKHSLCLPPSVLHFLLPKL